MATITKKLTPRRASPAPKAGSEPSDILAHAMLVQVHMGVWEARKHDREVTEKVNAEYQADPHAGRYHKHLFGGSVEELGQVLTAAARVRQTHLQQTLPWTDAGWRILPTTNYFEYTEAMRAAINAYDAAADRLAEVYPSLVRGAEKKLHTMYRKADYPTAQEVRAKYYAGLEFSPVPSGADFRVELPKEDVAKIAKRVEDRVAEAVRAAMEEAWSRLGEAVSALQDRLAGGGKGLRDTMIDRVREVAEVLGRLNLTHDATLEKVRAQVLADLKGLDAESLRKDEKQCETVAAKAAQILKQMEGLYTPAPKEAE